MPVSIAVVTDDTKYRKGLVRLLRATGGFDVSGAYSTSADALKDVRRLIPGIILIDLDLADGSGVQCIRQVRHAFPSADIVAISDAASEESVFRALHVGANGVVNKSTPPDQIVEACKVVVNGGAFINENIARTLLEHVRSYPIIAARDHTLSARELQVVRCMDQGLNYSEIAEKLYISIETVRRHCHNIYRKLNVRNRTEALGVLRNLKDTGRKR